MVGAAPGNVEITSSPKTNMRNTCGRCRRLSRGLRESNVSGGEAHESISAAILRNKPATSDSMRLSHKPGWVQECVRVAFFNTANAQNIHTCTRTHTDIESHIYYHIVTLATQINWNINKSVPWRTFQDLKSSTRTRRTPPPLNSHTEVIHSHTWEMFLAAAVGPEK